MSSNLLNQLSADERWIVTGAIVRTVIIAFVLIVRFSCKLTRKQRDMRLGWDDFWIVFAVALNWTGEVLTAWNVVRTHGGIFIVMQNGDRKGAYNYLMVQSICAVFYVISLASTCISVLCLYNRLFGLDSTFLRNSRVLMSISTLWGLGSMFGALFICTPPSNLWNLKDLDKCGNYNAFMLCIGILEILLLMAILLLPVKPILGLNLSLGIRVSILSTFLVGSFAVISAIVRLVFVYHQGPMLESVAVKDLLLWSGIHITAAQVSACLPVMRPAWTKGYVVAKHIMSYYVDVFSLRSRRHESIALSDTTKKRGAENDLTLHRRIVTA